jgi:peptidoglycan-associated lipoprotein
MSRHVLFLAATLIVFLGCAHQQPKPRAAAPAAKSAVAAVVPAQRPRPGGQDAIFFDFDSALIRDDARPVLQRVAAQVDNESGSVNIEGNCDEVGTIEYNLALGEHRAVAAKEYLVRMGVPAGRIATVSYGAQRPKDPGHDEAAHAKNRRDDLLVQ